MPCIPHAPFLSHSKINQVDFQPSDSNYVCASGNGVLKFFRLSDGQFKVMPLTMGKREPQNYLCHQWLDSDRCVVATDTGELLLFESYELKCSLSSSPADGNSIDSIVAYGAKAGSHQGFICGGDDGMLYLFEYSEDQREHYKMRQSFPIKDHASKVTNVAVSPSEDSLACTLANHQMFVLPLSSTDMFKSEEMHFEPLATDVHSGCISGLDTCVRKPLIATCGLDRSVKVWNYLDSSVDLRKTFAEEAYSIAFHPSGLHILVGFSDKLRLLNLLMDDIRVFKEFPIKACKDAIFAHGGHVFAAIDSQSIKVYNTCVPLS